MSAGDFIRKHCPKARDIEALIDALDRYMPRFGIDTPQERAMFLAQAAHESGHFTTFTENLNYSAAGLRRTWPNRFPSDSMANRYARKPERIANLVYASRMGNSDETSGDGWRYRGRGIFQLTGKANYQAFAKDHPDIPVMQNPDILTNTAEAVISACWYWKRNNLGAAAHDVVAATKRINGGTIGLDERRKLFEQAMA